MKRRIVPKGKQNGLAIVEFTIVIPMLLLLFIATAEMGKLLYDYNTLTKAQRNGVRFLATHVRTGETANITSTQSVEYSYVAPARNLVVYGDIAGSGDPVLRGLSTADVAFDAPSANEIRVTVTYDYTPMVFTSLPTFGLGDPVDLGLTLSSAITVRAMLGG